jgi:3-hydroxymyristoyl/3-hydroxydecanoyl-(acyl carrier protein) dehydratase
MIMIDYTNYIQTEDEEILINHIKQVTNRDFFLFNYFFGLVSRVPMQ